MNKFSGLKKALRILPDEGRPIKTFGRELLFLKNLALSNLAQHFTGSTLPDIRTVYWIDPFKVQYHTNHLHSSNWEERVFPQEGKLKLVQKGDWDLLKHRVADMKVCRAVEGRIRRGEPWQSSDYYQEAARLIRDGQKPWGCADRASFERFCNKVDRLIESISKQGYRENATLAVDSQTYCSLFGHQEILVNISRDGFPLFQDGRHRLAIARALGLKKIPVQILVRHSEWQAFREFMQRMARGRGGASNGEGFLRQNPIHFDLSDIPAELDCGDRWNAIMEHVSAGNGTALDIGANLGFFCHKLEELGYSCFGIEHLPDIAYAAHKIAYAERRHFRIITGDVLAKETLTPVGTSTFRVVLALNIFHHFIKTETHYARLRDFMGRIRTDILFFEPHLPDDPSMRGAYANPSSEEFVRLIQNWGGFGSAVLIGSTSSGRKIFKLVK